ncbi:carbamoyltransferase HypF [Methanocaldococcus fervens]|uniref:Carbamoyltransferase n=1 Tax=Methanocaldococcus fervens (strain DSM 4213 / JCM 15782 / AG86) TaxID=573064 RepID=C7P8K5_METFA|nr:carbamoyltransferase HypF [Methanocaldococcus fervens]ACV24887.1 (NiFe) hydrogenase maturation protein HypF [Methanocaldococcus fervens AG86]
MMKVRIKVKGIVQGVGFRPFVYRIAKKNNLKGFVKNMGNYVEIVVEGKKEDIENFIKDLKNKKPPLSRIDKLDIEEINDNLSFDDFYIIKSEDSREEEEGTIPADVAICDDCLKEMFDKNDRRYRYPFTACTTCGPRFTIVEKLPYDRENTSMRDFPLCEKCLEEYKNPLDRRFHAQATCCPVCGPKVFLSDGKEVIAEKDEAIKEAVKLLEEGKILAIKGIGGTHLACKVSENEPVLNLRKRLGRPTQPFAVMSKRDYVDLFAEVDEDERNMLLSLRRPIVVLKKSENYDKYFSKYVSNLDTIGVMLPYSGLHYLLFDKEIAYVMTSANLPGLPMVKDNDEILKKLDGIADYFLLHNRRIVNRCDDSVVKKVANRLVFLRRSRGFAPEPIKVDVENDKNILCVGAELNSTACIVKKNKFYLTQYIGNTSKYETFCYLRDAINNILRLTNTNKIDAVVCDLHPQFNSTKLAEELADKFGAEIFRVQHHFAHAYSLLGDNNYFDDAVVLSLDGVGYGLDGNIWGGEVLLFKDGKIERVGHLEEQYQLGGDLATKYPLRMLLSILYKAIGEEAFDFIKKYNFFSEKELALLKFQLEKKLNCPITTSTGRVLDAVSALLGICFEKTYDGEPSIRLEPEANKFKGNMEIEPKIKNNILDTTELIYKSYEMLLNDESKEKIAYFAHIYIADGLFEIAKKMADRTGINAVGITGGVSYNRIITERVMNNAKREGFDFIYHNRVPNGDGGICFGQGIAYILKNRAEPYG